MTLALEIEKEKKKSKIEGKAESIKSLMETMSLTAEEAMKALQIPIKDFSKYSAFL